MNKDDAAGGQAEGAGGRQSPAGSAEAGRDIAATGLYYAASGEAWEAGLAAQRRSFGLIMLPAYIWRELIKVTFLAIGVFSLVLMAVFAGQVLRDGIGPYTLARILPNFLPLICPFVLPLAIITGVIICYSRLARDNEILAAYASGVHPLWLAIPALLTSVIAIFITLYLNESALKPAIANIERLVVEDHANIIQRMLSRPGNITAQAGNEYLSLSRLAPSAESGGQAALDITRFALKPPEIEADGFAWDGAYPYPAKRLVARDHLFRDLSKGAGDRLILEMLVTKSLLQDLNPSNLNKTTMAEADTGVERIIVGERPSVTIHSNRASFWPILDLARDLQAAEADIRAIEAAGRRHELSEVNLKRMEELRRRVRNRISEINMRLALSVACLSFAVLGIPLGMRSMGTVPPSFGIGIVVSGVYFLLLKTLEHSASAGLLPQWVIWTPDVLVLAIGLFLWFVNPRRT